uniref:Eukaryotic translation initiation factor 4E family member 1B n=1 Tax=Malurus cyaneus samueli TaxID=2593467 RepID=A0A8C5UBJ3_9PASS
MIEHPLSLPSDGHCGFSRTTRARCGRRTCASSPNSALWRTSGRECPLCPFWRCSGGGSEPEAPISSSQQAATTPSSRYDTLCSGSPEHPALWGHPRCWQEAMSGWMLTAPQASSGWVLGGPDCPLAHPQDGIEPMWEDSQNKRGGRWLITLAKQQRHTELDRFWLETLLCLIGEMFDEYSDEVCGAVINIRAKGDKIAIWTREAENQAGVTHIGRVYKEHLGLSQNVAIGYQAHADTATKSNSLVKTKFVV